MVWYSDRGAGGTCCQGNDHRPVFSNKRTQGLLRAKQENGKVIRVFIPQH